MEKYDSITHSKFRTIKSNLIFLKFICLSHSETKFSTHSGKKGEKKLFTNTVDILSACSPQQLTRCSDASRKCI